MGLVIWTSGGRAGIRRAGAVGGADAPKCQQRVRASPVQADHRNVTISKIDAVRMIYISPNFKFHDVPCCCPNTITEALLSVPCIHPGYFTITASR
ncbi:hypothetical protein [Alicyclobacillus tolerans]|uniref:hypothetical protein n=1 Tax=Alicyclobacillus tolerans TaxID=90970 RepID=UPI00101AEC86|nr:hypothetical protein [Alicyclobacillus montanus]